MHYTKQRAHVLYQTKDTWITTYGEEGRRCARRCLKNSIKKIKTKEFVGGSVLKRRYIFLARKVIFFIKLKAIFNLVNLYK